MYCIIKRRYLEDLARAWFFILKAKYTAQNNLSGIF